jgi:hypothetical protein
MTMLDIPAEQHLWCPFCSHTEWVSDEDPDASFSQMLRHVRRSHPNADQAPAELWPRIKVVPID